MATFDGFTVNSTILSAADCMAAAVAGRLREVFGVDDAGVFAPDLAQVRGWAIALVNRQAGEARARIGTNIPFQGDVYQIKGAEARRWAADTAPNPANYPLIRAESVARGIAPAALAAEYLANANAWPLLIAAIEERRLGVITLIKNAATIEAIAAALAGPEWPV